MTGIENNNADAFHSEAKRLRDLGYEVVNPAELDLGDKATWSDYMRRDLADLLTCSGVATLPNFEKSRGASLEVKIAREIDLWVCESKNLLASVPER
jgi:hypothetical protein